MESYRDKTESILSLYGKITVGEARRLNVYKTFRRRPGRLRTLNLRPVSMGKGPFKITVNIVQAIQ